MDLAIRLHNASKTYRSYNNSWDRLWEIIKGGNRADCTYALHPISIDVPHGQVLGIIGDNGAGKSTLLKLIAGTLLPDMGGERQAYGQISALLELGSGFHPEMTGRENVYLGGTVLGLSVERIDALYDDIVAFAGIGDFMEKPVKTYSSGMFVRLAFAVATCVEPDILILDETLSVGDSSFARKSFERIMQFREMGKTILFCSHSLYQVEKICDRALWLDKGKLLMDDTPARVLAAYNQVLDGLARDDIKKKKISSSQATVHSRVPNNSAIISDIEASYGTQTGLDFQVRSRENSLKICTSYLIDPKLPAPSIAVAFIRRDGLVVGSASTHNDGFISQSSPDGHGKICINLEQLPLLRGQYSVDVYLVCERAVHVYDQALAIINLEITQVGVEQGITYLPHHWEQVQ